MTGAFDRILASTPLNKTAGSVVGRGDHYEPKIDRTAHWDVQPALRPFPKKAPRSLPNLTGLRHGRFTVLGLHNCPDSAKSHAGLRWVVRCVCGRYEVRSTKALRVAPPQDGNDRCLACVQTRKLQRLGTKQRSVEAFLAEKGCIAADQGRAA